MLLVVNIWPFRFQDLLTRLLLQPEESLERQRTEKRATQKSQAKPSTPAEKKNDVNVTIFSVFFNINVLTIEVN